jgi:hypothetical protein
MLVYINFKKKMPADACTLCDTGRIICASIIKHGTKETVTEDGQEANFPQRCIEEQHAHQRKY